MTRTPALDLYDETLAADCAPLTLRAGNGSLWNWDVPRWCAELDAADESALLRCRGPVLDVGCGPGRLTVALAARGRTVLGVDVAPAAVARTRRAGGMAVRASVFDPLPDEGRWESVLLMDGNIGIGGDPEVLLRRCAELLAPSGRIIVEVEREDVEEKLTVRLQHADGRVGPRFRWARVGEPAVDRAATRCGLRMVSGWRCHGRRFGLWQRFGTTRVPG